jgi:S-adenosylmethionine:tRNA ribosyltransferase-isomerase
VRSELFEYDLAPEQIAQTPLEPRDTSRLLHVQSEGAFQHLCFRHLPTLLNPGDLLVFNDTRVLPARLHGRKLNPSPSGEEGETSEGAQVEALLLRRLEGARWEALVYPGRRLRVGARLHFGAGELTAEVLEHGDEGSRVLEFAAPDGDPDAAIHRLGRAPLPPYIHTRLEDEERYQTVYAHPEHEGSAAAPTAGLHFTPAVFAALQERGVQTAAVTLHVGLATFRPIKADTIVEHEMHAEWYAVPPETAAAIAECRARGGRVVAVGTTTVRCLESWAAAGSAGSEGGFHPTRLYITPGYRFQLVDTLLTNFHMPRSSLLVLVSAFAGYETIRAAYAEALAQGYRFLSFGDAMLLHQQGE